MKKNLVILFFVTLFTGSFAQKNVGIGTNNPLTKLDLQGAISLHEGTALSLNNGGARAGVNDNVTLPAIPGTTDIASFYRITGPTTAFSLYGITPITGVDGELVTFVNTTGHVMTVINNNSSGTGSGIFTQIGGNIVDKAYSSITLQYNKTAGLWYVVATQNYTTTDLQGNPVSGNSPSTNDVLQWNGSSWTPASLSGIAGITGPTGLAGAAGNNGTNGAVGATGAAGPTGLTGPTGAAGTNGTNGAVGATGAMGPTGAAGINGTNGAVGATGAAGTNGTNGTAGATGAMGPTGAAGTNGTDGSNGAAGATGPTGPTGAQGVQGVTGAAGTNGTNGAAGATGVAGSNGANGTTGATGPSGATGSVGTLTTTGSSGSATLTGSALNIPNYTLAGLGGISLTSLSASAPLSYNNSTGAFSISQANTSTNGYLSSTDWNTFNNKQAALTFSLPLLNTANTVSIGYDNSTIKMNGSNQLYAVNTGTVTGVTASNGLTATGTSTPNITLGGNLTGNTSIVLNNGGTNYNLTLNTNSTTNSTGPSYYTGGNVVIGSNDGSGSVAPFGGVLRGPNAGFGNTAGGNLAVDAGYGYGSGAGGSVFINGGTSSGGTQGNVYLRGGYTSPNEGAVYINDDYKGPTFINSAGGIVTVGSPTAGSAQLNLAGGLVIDNAAANNGSISSAVATTAGNSITFGSGSGEGIASKRTATGNQYGLDFYTASTNRMAISNTGGVTLSSLGSGLVKSTSGLLANAVAGTDYQAPIAAGTGLYYSGTNTLASYWTLNGNNLYNNNNGGIGFIGIGTSTPSQLLTMASAVNSTTIRFAQHAPNGSGTDQFNVVGLDPVNGPYVSWISGLDMRFSTATNDGGTGWAEKMRITSNGALAFGGATNYGSSGNVLISAGSGGVPTWGAISSVAPFVSGVLPAANGGTGVNNAGTITNASNTTITGGGTLGLGGNTLTVPATGTAALGTGTANYASYWSGTNTLAAEQYLNVTRGGLGANMTAGAIGAIPYSTSATTYGTLADVATGSFLTSGGTGVAPAWTAASSATVGFNSWTKATTATTPAVKTDNQYVTGNVGLGDFSGASAAPVARLDVVGNTLIRGTNTNTPASQVSAFELLTGRTNAAALVTGQTSADIAIQYGGGGFRHFISSRHNGVASSNQNAIDFYLNNSTTSGGSSAPGTGNVAMMSITATGVGVGTNAPLSVLQTSRGSNGAALTSAQATNADLIVQSLANAAPARLMIATNNSTGGTTTGNQLEFWANSYGGIMGQVAQISTSSSQGSSSGNTYGNLIFGTSYNSSTPTSRMILWNHSTDALLQLTPSATTNWARLGTNGSALAVFTAGSDNTSSSPAMFVNNNGNVGVGTTAPYTTLDVVGNIYSSMHANTSEHDVSEQGSSYIGKKSGNTSDGFSGMHVQVGPYGSSGANNGSRIYFDTWGNSISTSRDVVSINEYGYLGIGLTTASYSLDINGAALHRAGGTSASTTGNQILFGYSSSANYMHDIKTRHNSGGAAGNAIDFYVWNYGTDASTAIGTKQVMSLDGTGYVGIGTTTPSGNLHINAANAGAVTGPSGSMIIANNVSGVSKGIWLTNTSGGSSGAIDIVGETFNGHTGAAPATIRFVDANYATDIAFRIKTGQGSGNANNGDVEVMRISSAAGYVGILTSSPLAPLDVNGSVSLSTANTSHTDPVNGTGYGGFTYLSTNGTTSNTGYSGSDGSYAISIRASNSVLAQCFFATSDERIKNIQGISNTTEDLETLDKIKVTNYTMRDEAAGKTPVKKVIAQQLKEVYPLAVKTSPLAQYIPNIYQTAQSFCVKDSFLIITLPNHLAATKDIHVGSNCKLFVADNAGAEKEIKGIIKNLEGSIITVALNVPFDEHNYGNRLFVYGTEINDLLTVDYDAISMLNVSATQEIAKRLAAVEEENERLKCSNTSLEEENIKLKSSINNKADVLDVNKLKAQLDDLKTLMEKNGIRTEK